MRDSRKIRCGNANLLDNAVTSDKISCVTNGEKFRNSSATGSPAACGTGHSSRFVSSTRAAGDSDAPKSIGKSPTRHNGSSGKKRTLSDLVTHRENHPSKPRYRAFRTVVTRFPLSRKSLEHPPMGDQKIPYVFISKRCAACGQFKKLWHFYRVKDESASVRRSWYPSARCKPCHNALRVQNRRDKKAQVSHD